MKPPLFSVPSVQNKFRDPLAARGKGWKDVFIALDANKDNRISFTEFANAVGSPPDYTAAAPAPAASAGSHSPERAEAARKELVKWAASLNEGMLQRSIKKYEHRAQASCPSLPSPHCPH